MWVHTEPYRVRLHRGVVGCQMFCSDADTLFRFRACTVFQSATKNAILVPNAVDCGDSRNNSASIRVLHRGALMATSGKFTESSEVKLHPAWVAFIQYCERLGHGEI